MIFLVTARFCKCAIHVRLLRRRIILRRFSQFLLRVHKKFISFLVVVVVVLS